MPRSPPARVVPAGAAPRAAARPAALLGTRLQRCRGLAGGPRRPRGVAGGRDFGCTAGGAGAGAGGAGGHGALRGAAGPVLVPTSHSRGGREQRAVPRGLRTAVLPLSPGAWGWEGPPGNIQSSPAVKADLAACCTA